jgi:hypothetical protein
MTGSRPVTYCSFVWKWSAGHIKPTLRITSNAEALWPKANWQSFDFGLSKQLFHTSQTGPPFCPFSWVTTFSSAKRVSGWPRGRNLGGVTGELRRLSLKKYPPVETLVTYLTLRPVGWSYSPRVVGQKVSFWPLFHLSHKRSCREPRTVPVQHSILAETNKLAVGGVNHCSSHCSWHRCLAKFRGLMHKGKCGAVSSRETHFVVLCAQ